MKFLRSLVEVIVITALAVFAVISIRQYVFNPYSISGASMIPSFNDGDYVFVDKMSYRFWSPTRGEVIVFHSPGIEGEDLVKRIIGLPGERVVVQNGQVTVINKDDPDGIVLRESYLDPSGETSGFADIELGEDEYFVMGDNRSVSFDSRSWGPLDSENIVGMVRLRIWPLDAARAFAAPQY